MNVTEFMSKNVTTCNQDETVGEAAKKMLKMNVSVMPIVDGDNKLVGVVTQSDFVGKQIDVPHALVSIKRLFGQDFNATDIEEVYRKTKSKKLSEVMSKNVTTVTPDYTLDDVVGLMMKKHLKRIPVVENEKIVGLVTRKDIIKAFELTK